MVRNLQIPGWTDADTGNRQGDRMPVEPSQDGEATGLKLCSENQRELLRDEGGKLMRIGSENSRVGQGCPRAQHEFSLHPLFAKAVAQVCRVLVVALIVLTGSSKIASANMQPSYQALNAGRALPPERPPTPEQLAAARGMESLMIDNLIQQLRKTVPESELMPASQGERVFQQMLDSEYARMLSESGGIGIADLVLDQLTGKR